MPCADKLEEDRATNLLHEGVLRFEEGNYARAYELLYPLAEVGDAKAQCYVASMYQGGLGVAADGALAVLWYLRAAQQDVRKEYVSAIAYNNLATIFTTGMPKVAADPNLAEIYLLSARRLGLPSGG